MSQRCRLRPWWSRCDLLGHDGVMKRVRHAIVEMDENVHVTYTFGVQAANDKLTHGLWVPQGIRSTRSPGWGIRGIGYVKQPAVPIERPDIDHETRRVTLIRLPYCPLCKPKGLRQPYVDLRRQRVSAEGVYHLAAMGPDLLFAFPDNGPLLTRMP